MLPRCKGGSRPQHAQISAPALLQQLHSVAAEAARNSARLAMPAKSAQSPPSVLAVSRGTAKERGAEVAEAKRAQAARDFFPVEQSLSESSSDTFPPAIWLRLATSTIRRNCKRHYDDKNATATTTTSDSSSQRAGSRRCSFLDNRVIFYRFLNVTVIRIQHGCRTSLYVTRCVLFDVCFFELFFFLPKCMLTSTLSRFPDAVDAETYVLPTLSHLEICPGEAARQLPAPPDHDVPQPGRPCPSNMARRQNRGDPDYTIRPALDSLLDRTRSVPYSTC